MRWWPAGRVSEDVNDGIPRGALGMKGSWVLRERRRRWELVGEMKSCSVGRGRDAIGMEVADADEYGRWNRRWRGILVRIVVVVVVQAMLPPVKLMWLENVGKPRCGAWRL